MVIYHTYDIKFMYFAFLFLPRVCDIQFIEVYSTFVNIEKSYKCLFKHIIISIIFMREF